MFEWLWNRKSREEVLADLIREILDAIEDEHVDVQEIEQLRARAYEVLLAYGLDK